MALDYYTLNDLHEAVPCDVMTWAAEFEKIEKRRVASYYHPWTWEHVSTVFLGLNHNFSESGQPPLIFETMIFGGPYDEYQERCSTWTQALEMHERAVKLTKKPYVVKLLNVWLSRLPWKWYWLRDSYKKRFNGLWTAIKRWACLP